MTIWHFGHAINVNLDMLLSPNLIGLFSLMYNLEVVLFD